MRTKRLGASAVRALLESIVNEAAVADEETSRDIIKKFSKGVTAMGVNVNKLTPLATGTHGTAFDAGNGRVLKITNDEKEAAIAAALIGKDIKNIVKFFSVVHFKDTPYYAVLQEKLQPMPPQDGKRLNDLLVMTGLPLWIKRSGGSWDKVKELTKQYALSQVKKKFPEGHNSPEAQDFAKSIIGAWDTLIKQFRIKDMFNTLQELGIEFHDYHAGNMMLRGDDIVLIDLGMSKLNGEPGKIETVSEPKVK